MADFRAALGRGGDRMMAHMTPGEAVIPRGTMTPKLWSAFSEALSRQGMMPEQYVVGSGYNSVNPYTGQPEFQRTGFEGSPEMGGSRLSEDDPRRSGQISGPEGGVGGGGMLGGLAPRINPEMGGGQARRQQTQMIEQVPQDQWGMTSGGEFGEVRTGDYGPFLDLVAPGPINALMDLAGVETTFEYVDPMPGHGQRGGYDFNVGPEQGGDRGERRRRQGLAGQRTQMPQTYVRPPELDIPNFLGLSGQMSPLQLRSALASRALSGDAGIYRSPEAQSYYNNLLQRTLISDTGELFGLDVLLPIELQYLAQIRGIENPTDTATLLEALA